VDHQEKNKAFFGIFFVFLALFLTSCSSWFLPQLPVTLNSKLSNIYPFLVLKSKLLKELRIFSEKDFLSELKGFESEEGMLLDVPRFSNFRIRGTIANACADTKGPHEIGGFMSPSTTKFCQMCLMSKKRT